MNNKKVKELARKIGINLKKKNISPNQLIKGMEDEKKEHGKNSQLPIVLDNNKATLAKIALAHLIKDKNYYKNL